MACRTQRGPGLRERIDGPPTYLAMMLPGSARLNVQVRPSVGLKTAEGFVVSSAG